MGSNINLGKTVATLRRKKGLTQDELSTKAGISYSTLAKLERGAIASPSVFTMADIAKVLGVSLDEIINPDLVASPKAIKSSGEIKFVYCDVNGVLVRFFHRAFSSLSNETGISIDRIESTFWHYNDPANRGEITTNEFNEALDLKLGLKLGTTNWEERYFSHIEPIQSMHDCLSEISKKVNVGLLSDNFSGFLQKMITAGLLPDITYASVVESASVGLKKPDQKIYQVAEKMAKTPGENIFFIDDSRANLIAAEKRGWRVLWFDEFRPKESVKRISQALASGQSQQLIS